MSYLELFQQDPAALILVFILSLVITLVAYGAFPLIFAKTCKKSITSRKYRILCFGINAIVMFLFIIANGRASSGGAYVLWTLVFSNRGVRTLEERGCLKEKTSPNEPNPSAECVASHTADDEERQTIEHTIPLAEEVQNQKKVTRVVVRKVSEKTNRTSPQSSESKTVSTPRYKLAIILLSVFLVLSLAGNVVLGIIAKQETTALNTKLETTQRRITVLQNDSNNYRHKWYASETDLASLQQRLVICEPSSKLYHTLYCSDSLSFIVKNGVGEDFYLDANVAEQFGYSPCGKCHR